MFFLLPPERGTIPFRRSSHLTQFPGFPGKAGIRPVLEYGFALVNRLRDALPCGARSNEVGINPARDAPPTASRDYVVALTAGLRSLKLIQKCSGKQPMAMMAICAATKIPRAKRTPSVNP